MFVARFSLRNIPLNEKRMIPLTEKKKSRPESVDCTPPDYIMPGSAERPLLPLHPGLTKENKAPQCLKVRSQKVPSVETIFRIFRFQNK